LTAKISPDIIIIVKGNPDKSTGQEVSEMEIDSMTQTELASYLETLARLVEATAKDPQDAANAHLIESITTGTMSRLIAVGLMDIHKI